MKLVRFNVDWILGNDPANRGYLGHSGNRFELVTQVPILKAAQIGQTALMAVVHERVFIDPTCTSRIRPDDGMHARGQATRDLLLVLKIVRTRPVQISTIFEDDSHVGISRHDVSWT